jgi:hypothetical protein
MKAPVRDKSSQCEGKKAYATRGAARERAFPADTAYRCPHCQQWQLSGGGFFRPMRPGSRTRQLYAGFDDDVSSAAR